MELHIFAAPAGATVGAVKSTGAPTPPYTRWPHGLPLTPSERTRAMVVEDDDALSSLMVALLEDEGYEIRVAPDGAQAVSVLETWHPNVIVLDLRMPRMDGWRFREAQRANPDLCDIPVVVVSALTNLPEHVAGLDAAAVVAKPFELDVLLAAIARTAGRS